MLKGIHDGTKGKLIFMFCRRKNVDLIFLQEIHSGDIDMKFWNAQSGDLCYFCHGTPQSAGVAILLHKFKSDIDESSFSDEGRWIILVFKLDNTFFIVWNLYSYNNPALGKSMFI